MIKYKYAYNSLGNIIDIDSLSKEPKRPKEKYSCVSCNNELIPKLKANIRKKHFAHKEETTCNVETYLHNLGKELFYQEYNKCKSENTSFFIEINQQKIKNKNILKYDCTQILSKPLVKYDLIKYFPEIKKEEGENSFIADILLISEDRKEKIFFEVNVTHPSTEKKINSGYRIIELTVKNDADLNIIKNHLISIKNPNVKFFNFKKEKSMRTLIIYDSFFGNTEQISGAIGRALASDNIVKVVKITDLEPDQLTGVELLIVGSPTRAFRPTKPIVKFLKNLSNKALKGVKVAAFDTRINPADANSRFLNCMVKIFGYAAEPIAKRLVKKDGEPVLPSQGFFVKASEGPLKEGELERAAKWAADLN